MKNPSSCLVWLVVAWTVLVPAATRCSEAPGDLTVECSVPGYHLIPSRAGINLELERAGKALIEGPGAELAFLSLPGCKVETILPPVKQRPASPVFVSARGDVLYDGGLSDLRTIFLKPAGKPAVVLQQPTEPGLAFWLPVLSDDGSAVVWSVRQVRGNGNVNQHLQVRDLASGTERSIALESDSMGYELLGANVSANEYALVGYPNRVIIVDDTGKIKWGPHEASAIEHVHDAFRRVGDGWVAWDIARINGKAVRLQWSLPAGSGQREFPLVSFESVAVDPGGKLIAISASSSNWLTDEEWISIMRVADGKDIFRRTLPKWSRVQLAFLDGEHLTMTTKAGIDVVRVPWSDSAQLAAAAVAEALPANPLDVSRRMLAYVELLAQSFGLKLEKTTADTGAKLIGRWKLEDVGASKGCSGEMPPVEFERDVFTYNTGFEEKRLPYAVTDQYIKVGDPPYSDGFMVFPMNGGFYLPSRECGLVKLERMP